MASRTAPIVNGTPTYLSIVFRLVDHRGDLRAISLRVPVGTLDADIENVALFLQAATNASLYEIQVKQVYSGERAAANADDAVFESLYDNIAINFKDVPADSQQTAYIPAPLGGLILDGDVVDTTAVAYINYRGAVDTVLAGDYVPVTARFTERREKNDATPA